jgi:SAM-dependent methyltransferase
MQITKPWHEDDSFWQTWGPYMFTEKRVADATEEVVKIIKLLNLQPGASDLDLGCGIGRISLAFARQGYRVTGLDRTVGYLDQARQQAEKENLNAEFIHGDMRTFVHPDAFDCVVNMFTAFGYFEDPADDRRVVNNVFKSLKPGGAFLIDMHGKETLAKIFQERNWEEKDGVIVIQERKVSQNWSWMWNRWIMLKANERVEHEITHRLYAGTEAQALLTGCGFGRADIYGNLDGAAYDHLARRLIAVGHM